MLMVKSLIMVIEKMARNSQAELKIHRKEQRQDKIVSKAYYSEQNTKHMRIIKRISRRVVIKYASIREP